MPLLGAEEGAERWWPEMAVDGSACVDGAVVVGSLSDESETTLGMGLQPTEP